MFMSMCALQAVPERCNEVSGPEVVRPTAVKLPLSDHYIETYSEAEDACSHMVQREFERKERGHTQNLEKVYMTCAITAHIDRS